MIALTSTAATPLTWEAQRGGRAFELRCGDAVAATLARHGRLDMVWANAGMAAFGYFISWWFESDRLSNPWLLLLLCAAVLYCVVRGFLGWYIFLQCRRPEWSDFWPRWPRWMPPPNWHGWG